MGNSLPVLATAETGSSEPARPAFREELRSVINRYSMENGSDCPDFILAQFLHNCLLAFDAASLRRDQFFGFRPFGKSRDGA